MMILVTVEKESINFKPVELFEKLKEEGSFILETAKEKGRSFRYSYLAEEADFYLKVQGEKIILLNNDFSIKEEIKEDFFKYLSELLKDKVENKEFPFVGGFVGYCSYDLSKSYERKLSSKNEDVIKTPDAFFGYYKKFIVYDHKKEKLFLAKLISNSEEIEEVKKELNVYYYELINREVKKDKEKKKSEKFNFKSNYSKEEFISKVERAKEYINEGEIFQVVLSQQLEKKINLEAIEIYKRLKIVNPSPYMYYLNFKDFEIVGSSPEILVSLDEEEGRTNPIAGTIKRGEKEDKELIEILRGDAKERAEHMMLLDLGRNDLGKVSEFGTVKVEELMKEEIFSHIIHLSSKVVGTLKKQYGAVDLLKAVMPAGTVSGAPKHRAMEIIEELENRRRGIYSGAIGYFSANGNMDMAITIRTIVVKEGKAYIQAGAGIVYDSVPEKEYEETLNKLMALMEVLK
ncbi:MAG: anthranilate synthase component I [Sarcina sp.]